MASGFNHYSRRNYGSTLKRRWRMSSIRDAAAPDTVRDQRSIARYAKMLRKKTGASGAKLREMVREGVAKSQKYKTMRNSQGRGGFGWSGSKAAENRKLKKQVYGTKAARRRNPLATGWKGKTGAGRSAASKKAWATRKKLYGPSGKGKSGGSRRRKR